MVYGPVSSGRGRPSDHDAERVRFYGDDIGAVVAEDEVAAAQALRAIKAEYEEYPFRYGWQGCHEGGCSAIHENYPGNVLKHTMIRKGNYEEAIREPGLIKVEGWYSTPTVQHRHIENFICTAQMEGERISMLSSTQIPHIVRRVVGQALGIDWGRADYQALHRRRLRQQAGRSV